MCGAGSSTRRERRSGRSSWSTRIRPTGKCGALDRRRWRRELRGGVGELRGPGTGAPCSGARLRTPVRRLGDTPGPDFAVQRRHDRRTGGPRVAVAPNGSSAVRLQSDRNECLVRRRRMDADVRCFGVPVTADVAVDNPPPPPPGAEEWGLADTPSVAADEAGHFVVAWTAGSTSTSTTTTTATTNATSGRAATMRWASRSMAVPR